MTLYIRRNGTKVEVKIPTVLDYHYNFSIECNDDVRAELLARDMDGRIERAVAGARKQAYEDGWRDAKAKKVAKRSWFSPYLEIE